MVLINFFILSLSLFASQTKLLEVLSQDNIRYSSSVTNISIYQKGSSTLAYSTRTSAGEIIRLEGFVSFEVRKHPTKDLFLISSKEDNFLNIKSTHEAKIYLFNLTDKSLLFLGNGINSEFSFNGEYLNYYSAVQKKIIFHKMLDINSPKEILLNTKNTLFIPEVEIINDQNIYFTDINSDNELGILKLNSQNNSRSMIYKSSMNNLNLELLADSEKIFILDSTLEKKGHCFIYSLNINNVDISKREMLFDSQTGSCHQIDNYNENLSFIKNIDVANDLSEILILDMKSKKSYIISDLNYVQNYYIMNGNIFIFFRDTYYTTIKEKDFIIKKEFKEINKI